MSLQVSISGAGLVGCLTAIYLARRGYTVDLFEKRPDMRRHDISAGRSINLALANRGRVPLAEVGLLEKFEPLIIPMRARMLHDEQGQLQSVPYGQREHEVIYSVSRGELNKALMSAAEDTGRVKIHFQQAITGVDFSSRQITVLDELNGQPHTKIYQKLIGADGAGSPVRKAMDAWHGQASREDKLGHAYKELHIDADTQGHFRMEKHALHIWPRGDYMLIALPNPDGSFTVTLFLPEQGADSFAQLQTPEAVQELFARRFPDAQALMPDLPQRFFANPTGMLGTVHCPNWVVGDHALLIGDAAHAIVPFHGQGMNCGFEDAATLNQLLATHGDNWADALPAYQAARLPNAEAIAQMALENYVEMRASVRDPKFLLKKQVGFELENRFPGRFIPRYSMVMFHALPYRDALSRGQAQEQLLDALCEGHTQFETIDWSRAEALVAHYCRW